MPSPIATAAAIAVTDASTGETRRRELDRNDVLLLRSGGFEDPLPERGARCRAVGSDGEAAGDLPEGRELLLARLAALEMGLEGLPLGRVERIQRVAGSQLVDVDFHDPSSVPSCRSSRNRVSPANILLLIVPSGTPSLSDSSDCEKPP